MLRNIYLENTPLSEALSRWLTKLDNEGITTPFSGDTVSVLDALGRVTAEAVIARVSSPFYHSSAMDGYAVRFTDTFGASERTPKLRNGAGSEIEVELLRSMQEIKNTIFYSCGKRTV
jgi:putative molybdopterin biosynthesis protein